SVWPSGARATEVIVPRGASVRVCSSPVSRSHSRSAFSQPHEASVLPSGDRATIAPPLQVFLLRWPGACQSRLPVPASQTSIRPPSPSVTSLWPSGVKTTLLRQGPLPSLRVAWPVATTQRRILPSLLPVARVLPSVVKASRAVKVFFP